jgi:hypothetical protein
MYIFFCSRRRRRRRPRHRRRRRHRSTATATMTDRTRWFMHLRIIINRRILRGREKKCTTHLCGGTDMECVWREREKERVSETTAAADGDSFAGNNNHFRRGKKKGTSTNNRVVPFSFREPKGAKNDAYTILWRNDDINLCVCVRVCTVRGVCVRSHVRLWENFYYYYYYYIMTRWIIRNCRGNGQFLAQSTLCFII